MGSHCRHRHFISCGCLWIGNALVPVAYYDDEGNHVKECTKCQKVLPVEDYYKHSAGAGNDGLHARCRECMLAQYRDQNQRRAKKRKQKSHKLNPTQVNWIKEQKGKLSIRETAKQFSKRFFAIKINPSTVQRIFAGKIHITPGEADTVSIYDLLEGASEFTGSVEDYLAATDPKKVKY